MRGFMNSLTLQAVLILWIICLANGAPYSKYGRTCKDIGCLPRETCVMAYESCSFSQQENVSCGRYPTCKKITDSQGTQQNSGQSSPSLPTSNPLPNIWNLPTTTPPTTTTRSTTTTTTTRRSWTTRAPFYNPSNPSYGGGGSYYGNRYGDDSLFGGSSNTRPTTRYTTKRPSSSSNINGFLSGLSNILGGDVGKFIGSAINSRGGSSGSGSFGNFGSFGGFNTRPLIENKNSRGSLFSENTGTSRSTNVGGYPVTRYGEASPTSSNAKPSHGNYGWNLS